MRFFRVLYGDELRNCWHMHPVANSSHHRPPLQWIDRWDKHDKQSGEVHEANYPLECNEGLNSVIFTSRARRVFLSAPAKFTPEYIRENWDSVEIYEVGQLDGVCAFSTAAGCLAWTSKDSRFQQNPNNFDFVVFEGERVSDAPEDEGVVAKVVEKKNGLMKLDEFKRLYPS